MKTIKEILNNIQLEKLKSFLNNIDMFVEGEMEYNPEPGKTIIIRQPIIDATFEENEIIISIYYNSFIKYGKMQIKYKEDIVFKTEFQYFRKLYSILEINNEKNENSKLEELEKENKKLKEENLKLKEENERMRKEIEKLIAVGKFLEGQLKNTIFVNSLRLSEALRDIQEFFKKFENHYLNENSNEYDCGEEYEYRDNNSYNKDDKNNCEE